MDVVILGGGISGLSAAWFYHKKHPHHRITLLEKSSRLGGWIETVSGEGFSFEKGPRTLSCSRSPKLLELIHELGLQPNLFFSSPEAKRRFLWKGGKLRSLQSFWPSLLWAGFKEAFLTPAQNLEDESIYEFASRRFGSKIADDFFDPLTLGIYAGDIRKLSIRSCFPSLWLAERKHGSVVRSFFKKKKKGPSGLFTLEGGLSALIEKLEKILPIQIVKECEVLAISPKILTSQGIFPADQILSALPAHEISRLTQIPLQIPYRSIWVVHMGFSTPVLPKKGFGYLVPTKEKENLLGMVWDSSIFAPEKRTRLTAMIREEAKNPLDDALSALEHHLNILQTPEYISSHLASHAVPQCEVGHEAKIFQFERLVREHFPHLSLTGNYLEGTSLEACVARSSKIVANI